MSACPSFSLRSRCWVLWPWLSKSSWGHKRLFCELIYELLNSSFCSLSHRHTYTCILRKKKIVNLWVDFHCLVCALYFSPLLPISLLQPKSSYKLQCPPECAVHAIYLFPLSWHHTGNQGLLPWEQHLATIALFDLGSDYNYMSSNKRDKKEVAAPCLY